MSDLVKLIMNDENGENHIICERRFIFDVLNSCFITDTIKRTIQIERITKEDKNAI